LKLAKRMSHSRKKKAGKRGLAEGGELPERNREKNSERAGLRRKG